MQFFVRTLDSQSSEKFFKHEKIPHFTNSHLPQHANDLTKCLFGEPGWRECPNSLPASVSIWRISLSVLKTYAYSGCCSSSHLWTSSGKYRLLGNTLAKTVRTLSLHTSIPTRRVKYCRASTETRVPAKLSYVMISLQPIWRVFFYKSVFSSTLWSSVGLGTEAERMYDLFSRVSATSLPSDFKGISVWISVFFWPKCISFVKQYCLNKNCVFRFFQNYEHFFLTGFWMKSHF